MDKNLLSREDFRNKVFQRDNYKCVICGNVAKDAHHIIERRLFDDGGYYLDNGASLCEEHHLEAEKTILTCEKIREAAKIKKIILPEHLYQDSEYLYDKWGNTILPNGKRLKGELFFDSSVQKILGMGGVLDDFINYVKYPRTFHLPWSEKTNKDDRILKNVDIFYSKEVVVTLKLDGQNISMYKDHIHARTLEKSNHPSQDWVKGYWAKISYEIPEGWRICGENLYAKHTIKYDDLENYFYGFSIWDEKNVCLSWNETLEYFSLLNITPVPVIYRGIFNEDEIKKVFKEYVNKHEGYVIRLSNSFNYSFFRKSVAKFVKQDFNILHGKWINSKIEKNELKK